MCHRLPLVSAILVALALAIAAPARAGDRRAPTREQRDLLDRQRRLPIRRGDSRDSVASRVSASRIAAGAAFDRTISPEATLAGHGYYLAYALTPDGQYVAVVPYEARGSIRILRAGDGATVRTIEAHEVEVSAMAITPDGRFIISVGRELDSVSGLPYTVVKAWRADGTLVRTFDGRFDAWMRTLAITPDGIYAWAGGEDGKIREWRIADGTR
jgi:WD40 repeat protein